MDYTENGFGKQLPAIPITGALVPDHPPAPAAQLSAVFHAEAQRTQRTQRGKKGFYS